MLVVRTGTGAAVLVSAVTPWDTRQDAQLELEPRDPADRSRLRSRSRHRSAAVTRPAASFAYWRDPIFVASSVAYSLNRWVAPAVLHAAAWRGHFADVLLVPVGLPLWLWLERRVGWREDDRMPRWQEIAFVLAVWSAGAELVAPHLFTRATGDVWDLAAYAGGALAAGLAWHVQDA